MEIILFRMASHLFFTESLQVEFVLISFSILFESTMKFDSILLQCVSWSYYLCHLLARREGGK